MAQKNSQENKSVCEKSMQVMMNIIKLSSISLVNMSLDNKRDKNRGLITIEPFKSFSSNSHMNKRQAPLSKSYLKEGCHSASYMEHGTKDDCLDEDNFSGYIERVHKRNQNALNTEIQNGKASAYIRTFHEKNSRDSSLGGFPLVLPPPPPAGLKK